jgi:hypothetical protein
LHWLCRHWDPTHFVKNCGFSQKIKTWLKISVLSLGSSTADLWKFDS